MKKIVSVLLVCMLLLPCLAFAQEDQATRLPKDVTFEMDYEAVKAKLGESVTEDEWDDDTGSLTLYDAAGIIGDLMGEIVTFEINLNNSAQVPRLSQIQISLLIGDDIVSDFREALEAITGIYGTPDSDPFDESGVAGYVEYGGLNASWTRDDVRINLSMSRMFGEYLSIDFSNRICYDAADLEVTE